MKTSLTFYLPSVSASDWLKHSLPPIPGSLVTNSFAALPPNVT